MEWENPRTSGKCFLVETVHLATNATTASREDSKAKEAAIMNAIGVTQKIRFCFAVTRPIQPRMGAGYSGTRFDHTGGFPEYQREKDIFRVSCQDIKCQA
mmetsp:Transcript_14191/g.39672  ORF Transcript_14191/g.39672 Transcript_14191/m.39672 type:complete len:100 (-) Transcript_14191:168-467(-)